MANDVSDQGTLPAATHIGRVGIRVAEMSELLPFYRDAIGCGLSRSDSTATLVAGDRPVLQLDETAGLAPRPPAAAGLFHVAIRLPDRGSLGDALTRLRATGTALSGASDHLVSEALYLRDPADNGLELYRDRPRDSWTRPRPGWVEMDTLPLALDDLAAARTGADQEILPDGTDVGHVHLEVTDLAASTAFYRDALGFSETTDAYPGARFLAAGGYHHHIGLNRWNQRTQPLGDHAGLDWFEVVLPTSAAREALLTRLDEHGETLAGRDPPTAIDPDGIDVRLVVAERS